MLSVARSQSKSVGLVWRSERALRSARNAPAEATQVAPPRIGTGEQRLGHELRSEPVADAVDRDLLRPADVDPERAKAAAPQLVAQGGAHLEHLLRVLGQVVDR